MQTTTRPTTYPQVWDNSQFFSGTDDPQIAITVEDIKATIITLANGCEPFTILAEVADTISPDDYADLTDKSNTLYRQRRALSKHMGNLSTFIYTALSTDTQDPHANTWMPILQKLSADLEQALTPLDIFLLRASEQFITHLFANPAMIDTAFLIHHERQLQDQLLSVSEEQLITALSTSGLHTWGNLYSELAGTLKTTIQGEEMGLAKAANLLSHPESGTRKAAWLGIRTAWATQQTAVATGLNAINGWRLEETEKRASTRRLHYLDESCHTSRISRATLDAMIETTYQQRNIGHRALNAMAKAIGQTQAHPWDVMAPAPAGDESEHISFEEAIAIIANAFSQLTPEMGDFATMMAKKGWIDGAPTPNRATGAYCSGFANPREPRIFMTYEGTMTNVLTLAHELGHAWHNWVMRDLPRLQCRYPMTLAETASIFAETLVREALMEKASTPAQKLEIAWQEAQSAAIFLLNIPARFEFEKRLVEARKVGTVRPAIMCKMMNNSWKMWFEDSLSEYDDLFWASKLHFSISELGFYNYPYLFGYLFSLGIYAQQPTERSSENIEAFNKRYTDLLRDTGTMTAEDLVQHHLNKDLSQAQFWQDSLTIVDKSVAQFEQLVDSVQSSR